MRTLEERLVAEGLVTGEALAPLVARARAAGRPLPLVLLDEGRMDEGALLKVFAEHYGLTAVRLDDLKVEPAAVKCLTAKLASHYGVVPVRLEGHSLTIAVSNPIDTTVVEDIETNSGYHVERVLASRSEVSAALQRHYGVGADTVERILADSPEPQEEDAGAAAPQDLERMAEDASVIRLVNQFLQEAIRDRATDIHLEVHRDEVTIRRRIDGVLYDTSVPRNIRQLYPAMISRIKLMSGLNIVERRLPQDGRARVRIGRADFDLRVSVIPAIHGEDVVIRILPTTMLFDLAHLGFSESHCALLEDLIARPHGIIFVTGPTGSGKSTTLYACLSRLNTRDNKILTIEDPVEYELAGITQTQVNRKIGLTFAYALRSMLRHDPDIMMVGEVRDPETAEVAIQTAMTGHLVLSTLHTNDAAGAAVRLIDMGVEPYLITSTVLAFIAQRLVRVICPECREPVDSSDGPAFHGRGCRPCNGSGYRGRVAVSEFLLLRPEIQELILRRVSAAEIRAKADGMGMRTLLQDGREKVASGVTTLEELLRVTSL